MDLTRAFATHAQAPLIAVTRRVLTETSWAGTGAGTFATILPTNRDVDEMATGPIAPTGRGRDRRGDGSTVPVGSSDGSDCTCRHAFGRCGAEEIHSSVAKANCVVTVTLLGFGNAAPV